MKNKRFAIVSDGKEIAYAMLLSHLMKFEEPEIIIMSNKMQDCAVEMYTPAVFMHTCIPKQTITILIGEVKNMEKPQDVRFNQFGISILQTGITTQILADPKKLSKEDYRQFIQYANDRRQEYMKLEKNYYEKVLSSDAHWISDEFSPVQSRGLFSAKNEIKAQKQQMYDCAAYVFYLDCLPELLLEEKI